jgi:hypothetical protein
MDYDQLSELNKEFAAETIAMLKDFTDVFYKWRKKSPRMAMVNAIHLPLNIIMQLIQRDTNHTFCKAVPELPDMFIRFMMPFTKLRKKWRKVSGVEFCKLYGELHGKQFDDWFVTPEQKETFKEWFDDDIKKHIE